MSKPILAIIGRPNVGKSTLFNRIIRKRDAIVDDQPGVTRDRKYADAEWSGVNFTIVDTGGYLPDSENLIHQAVLNQVHQAIDEADVIAFLVDVTTGITVIDQEITRILKRCNKPIIVAVNKVDNEIRELEVPAFYQLGLGDPVPVSAISGRSVGDFLDLVIERFPAAKLSIGAEEEPEIKIAVVGKPNVGKSSFVNAVLGQEKVIVTHIPGTTRDAIDTPFKYYGRRFLLIDTAGLRKRSRIKEAVEYFSTVRSVTSIQRCDVAVVVIDAQDGITDQDKTVIHQAVQFKKGVVLAINKWDLIEKNADTAMEYQRRIYEAIPYFSYLPTIFISALTRQRVFKVIETAQSVFEQRSKRIATSELNDYFEPIIAETPPAAVAGKEIKIKYVTQIKASPPVFAFFCNHPKLIKANYRSFLENKLRERFGFLGVPLTLVFRRK
ncbi:MAG: ribosome biogenesis GTPase Der [candidate division KSB1 bacterium]|nr:ribosome biogenesis GTPase Der [candidate division KSB1 bacterium]MDZ7335913.1 ribosome biogenesis GTPase Der [candidate division KSB1 bacterium]MDZ7356022.1 ribosome biogenesis GTPase Der [candidate division KSB1 bacterium]MDZ7377343.1 ribosome biogenesis GTPase Der [candidate division KSB1 bacterium]MDZ7400644.1 ribosome biogenesis GTPase Der [candidate division KSB1 bacterium]